MKRILAQAGPRSSLRLRTVVLIQTVGFALLLSGYAMSQTLSVGTASGTPGSTVSLTVSFTSGTTSVSGFLFDLGFPSSLSCVAVDTGSAASAAGKSASFSAATGSARVLIFGVNQNAIGSGPVAVVHLAIAAGTAAGTLTVSIGNISASDPSGNAVTVSGSGGSVTVQPVLDTVPPTVAITSPTSSGSYTTTSSPLSIGGTAADNVGVTQVSWVNSRGGGGTASGTTSWSASGITLLSGSNMITVTARDAAGNTGTATLTVTYTPSDMTPPTVAITSPTTMGSYTATSSPLMIGGTASDNVGVTMVTWSNSMGGSGTASGTTSWSASIGLMSGSNVITVRASDAAGNMGSAVLNVTYNASDTTPPVISAVSARLTSTTAVISWTTNEPADSEIDYGLTANYGSTVRDASLVASHAQTLTGLTAKTDYHFMVKSRDAAMNLAVSPDYGFKTLATDGSVKLILYYPSMSTSHRKKNAAAQNDTEYTAIALTNLDSVGATVTFTAYDATGAQISGTGITNPVTKTLAAGEQVPVIDYQIFGNAILGVGPLGWIQVESSTTQLAGFFMTFNSELTYLDGADISATLISSLVLPEVSGQDFTQLQLANPNVATASVRLDLIKADGSLQATSQQTIGAGGTLSADLFADIFPSVTADPGSYLRVSSSMGLLAYETIGKSSSDIAILGGEDTNAGASQLYSPQYAVGGPWRSTLSIVNLDATPGTLTLKLMSDLGMQIGASKFVNIAGGGKVYISDQAFFTDAVTTNPQQVVQGYVEVTGLGLHLAGSVVFGDALQGIFTSALPLVSTLQKSVIFSHVASDDQYYTGLAILNPNLTAAAATIDLFDSSGVLQASVTQTIPAGQRRSRLLTEYFPALVGQKWVSGYFRVTVDQGVACFALFGTQNYSVLSAIPAQPAP